METSYQYSRSAGYNKTVKLGEYARLRCYSKKAMKKAHPKGTYTVVGAVGEGLTNPEGQYQYGTGQMFYYNQNQSALWHRTIGYIRVGEGQYFAVVKKTKRPLFLLLAALLLVLALGLSLLLKNMNSLIDKAIVDYTPPESLNVEGVANSIAIPGYRNVYVVAGTDEATVALWNPATNSCYFRYTFIAEDGEVLYESGLIPPGKAITEQKLSRRIPKGEQELTIEIDTFSLEDQETPLNGGVIECSLIGITQ